MRFVSQSAIHLERQLLMPWLEKPKPTDAICKINLATGALTANPATDLNRRLPETKPTQVG
jgi:hypothetical protein